MIFIILLGLFVWHKRLICSEIPPMHGIPPITRCQLGPPLGAKYARPPNILFLASISFVHICLIGVVGLGGSSSRRSVVQPPGLRRWVCGYLTVHTCALTFFEGMWSASERLNFNLGEQCFTFTTYRTTAVYYQRQDLDSFKEQPGGTHAELASANIRCELKSYRNLWSPKTERDGPGTAAFRHK